MEFCANLISFFLNLITYMHAIPMLFLHNGLYEEVVLPHQTTTKTKEDTKNVFSVQSKGICRARLLFDFFPSIHF